MRDQDDHEKLRVSGGPMSHRSTIVIGIALLAAAAVSIGVDWSTFSQAPTVERTGIWEQLLAARQVTIALRLAILMGAAYLVASLVGLTLQGRWLTRIRGAEVDPAKSAEEQLEGLGSLNARAASLEDAVDEMRAVLTWLVGEHLRLREDDGESGEDR